MKKISKVFFSFILVALCACGTIPFAGCGEPDWQEVQSVSYVDAQGGGQLWSTIEWTATCELCAKTEYENAPEDKKESPQDHFTEPVVLNTATSYEAIDINKEEFFAHIDEKIGNFYYRGDIYTAPDYSYIFHYYYKCTYQSYKAKYVRVNFLDDNSIEIYYDGRTIRTFPNAYTITYFEN